MAAPPAAPSPFRLWHRLWLLSDVADTAMGAAMVARGELTGPTATEALTLTAGSAPVDLASLARPGPPNPAR